jgi:hypothetical protein
VQKVAKEPDSCERVRSMDRQAMSGNGMDLLLQGDDDFLQ